LVEFLDFLNTAPLSKEDDMPALDGIRILDMTQYEAGPSCTQALAWLGADVVKIEPPGMGDPGRSLAVGGGYSPYFCNWNANKRSVALDLAKPGGRDVLLRMLPHYDVFIENYGPGIVERFQLEYEKLKAVHPEVIYVQLKGFGSFGPYAHYKSYDMVAQAASGSFSSTGEMGGIPMLPGPTIGDSGTGVQAGMAILAAYVQRLRTGEGQQIELSMQEAVTYFMRTRIAFAGNWGEQAVPRLGNLVGGAPTGLYRCAGDGPNDYAYLITVTDRHWDALCLATERHDLVVDPRFESGAKRALHGAELFEEISRWTRQHGKYEVMRRLGDAGVPCSAILDTRDLYNDPHLLERGFVKIVEHPERGEVPLLGFPTRMSASHVEMKRAPFLGEHSDEVLRADLGLSDEELTSLRDEGVIG
jgi:formyl-CoA transferase